MKRYARKIVIIGFIVVFVGSSLRIPLAPAGEMVMPVMPRPGTMVNLSPAYIPAQLTGLTIHPDNALRFDFLIRQGDGNLTPQEKKIEYKKLVKYFLAALTIPEKDQWVNLSPYEQNRIIEDNFGKTEMGRDLLAQDYLLKQIASSLIYPESGLGKEFWGRVYERIHKEFSDTPSAGRNPDFFKTIPVNVGTFNKVWIMPDRAEVYEKGDTVYVLENHLKVMMEEDYLALEKNSKFKAESSKQKQDPANFGLQSSSFELRASSSLGSQIVREVILPELEKEVNEGKNFANLRQIYSGMILATWYKIALKESLLNKVYANKSKVAGVYQDPRNNEEIYQRYLTAFKKGVFNYIREDVNRDTKQLIPRKYFAGGALGNRAGELIRRFSLDNTDPNTVRLASGIFREPMDRASVALMNPSAQMTAQVPVVGQISRDSAQVGKVKLASNLEVDESDLRIVMHTLQRAFRKHLAGQDKNIKSEIYNLMRQYAGDALYLVLEYKREYDPHRKENVIVPKKKSDQDRFRDSRLSTYWPESKEVPDSIKEILGNCLRTPPGHSRGYSGDADLWIVSPLATDNDLVKAFRSGNYLDFLKAEPKETLFLDYDGYQTLERLIEQMGAFFSGQPAKEIGNALKEIRKMMTSHFPMHTQIEDFSNLILGILYLAGKGDKPATYDANFLENLPAMIEAKLTEVYGKKIAQDRINQWIGLGSGKYQAIELAIKGLGTKDVFEMRLRPFGLSLEKWKTLRTNVDPYWGSIHILKWIPEKAEYLIYLSNVGSTNKIIVSNLADLEVRRRSDTVTIIFPIDFAMAGEISAGPGRITDVGGIDMASKGMDFRIKGDGRGVPLPFAQQDMAQMSQISGFDPQILEISPVSNLPIVNELRVRSRQFQVNRNPV